MPYQSVFKYFYRTLLSDHFWSIRCFSWIYYHWVGSSMIFGIFFNSVVIVMHLTFGIIAYYTNTLRTAHQPETVVAEVLYYYITVKHIIFIPFSVMVWMIRGCGHYHRVISSIATVDEKLSKFGQRPSQNSTLWQFIPVVCLPLAVIGVLSWLDVNKIPMFSTLVKKCIWLYYEHYSVVVIIYIQGLFTYLALLIGDRYRAVNSVLRKISQEHSCGLRNTRQVTFDWIITIRELLAVHRRLFFAAENISKAFGVQLLTIAIISLSSTIGDLYNLYLMSSLGCGPRLPYGVGYLFRCQMHVVPLCIAAVCCSWTSAQEKYTSVLLQKMSVSDESLRMEISTFSLQLIHYDLHFSVCGFYNIDLSMIETIFGTIGTYLVILIQIGTPPHICTNSSMRASENITNSSVNYY